MAFDRNDSADLLALKTEINTDPDALGYVPGNTNQGIELINEVSTYIVSKLFISADDVRSTCTSDAYNNLSIDEQAWIRWMTPAGAGADNLVVTSDLRTQLTGPDDASMWAVANRTAMNAAMLDLIDVPGSRAQDLFGYDTAISSQDWLTAVNS